MTKDRDGDRLRYLPSAVMRGRRGVRGLLGGFSLPVRNGRGSMNRLSLYYGVEDPSSVTARPTCRKKQGVFRDFGVPRFRQPLTDTRFRAAAEVSE